jgi:hypothetical protein
MRLRLRTRNPSSVETMARKPSHLSSKDHPEPEGSGSERESIGSGSCRSQTVPADRSEGANVEAGEQNEVPATADSGAPG